MYYYIRSHKWGSKTLIGTQSTVRYGYVDSFADVMSYCAEASCPSPCCLRPFLPSIVLCCALPRPVDWCRVHEQAEIDAGRSTCRAVGRRAGQRPRPPGAGAVGACAGAAQEGGGARGRGGGAGARSCGPRGYRPQADGGRDGAARREAALSGALLSGWWRQAKSILLNFVIIANLRAGNYPWSHKRAPRP